MRRFKPRKCQVCGVVKSYQLMEELRSIYRVFPDLIDVCGNCGDKLNSHVDYFGEKKESDKKAVRDILINGVAVQDRFGAMMHAGYF